MPGIRTEIVSVFGKTINFKKFTIIIYNNSIPHNSSQGEELAAAAALQLPPSGASQPRGPPVRAVGPRLHHLPLVLGHLGGGTAVRPLQAQDAPRKATGDVHGYRG